MMAIDAGYEGSGWTVPRPRVTDAIGGALVRAHACAPALPDDMRRLLERLDRLSSRL